MGLGLLARLVVVVVGARARIRVRVRVRVWVRVRARVRIRVRVRVRLGGRGRARVTTPGEGGLHELVCADERASFVAGAVFDGKPFASGGRDTSEDQLGERERGVSWPHVKLWCGSNSVELLISSTAITNAANRPTLIALCWNSPPSRTSAGCAVAACAMQRATSAVQAHPKERPSPSRWTMRATRRRLRVAQKLQIHLEGGHRENVREVSGKTTRES